MARLEAGRYKVNVEFVKIVINFNTSIQPAQPVTNIGPDAFIVRILLIKPGYIDHMILYGFFSDIQTLMGGRTKRIAQEIKSPDYFSDEGFIRMFYYLQMVKHLVCLFNGLVQLPL
ncbi:MAG: hypothetical protein GY940_05890 [bacterium]|nr:hypothetical protein [bacterium]